MGESKDQARSGAEALEPSSALSFAEAATLAGVEVERIQALADSGELLFEGSRDRRRDRRIVRLIDLADAFPHVLGRPAEPEAVLPDPGPAPAEAAPVAAAEPVAVLREVDVPRPDLAEEVLASGASRDALVELAQDLETRLDLAERERQASTASLLLAQRRVLDLELQLRRRPWSRAGAAAAALLSITALVAVLRLPGLVRAAADEELGSARTEAATEMRALREAAEQSLADAAASRKAETQRLEAALAAATASAEDVARQARDGRVAAEERAAAQAARFDGERKELSDALEGLEARLRAADERDQRRAAELEVARDGASRERLRFEQQLEEAKRAAAAARAALAEERRLGATERDRHTAQMEELAARISASTRRLEELEEARRAEPVTTPKGEPETPGNEEDPRGRLMRLLTGLFGSGA